MRFVLFAALFLSAAVGSQAQTFDTPVEYLNFFNQEFAQLQDMQIEYSSVRAHLGSDIAEQKRQELLNRAQTTYDRIKGLQAYPNDKGIQANALKVVDVMLLIGNKDYHSQAMAKTGCDDCFPTILLEDQLVDKEVSTLSKAMSNTVKSIEQFAKAEDIELSDDGDNHETLLGKINRINGYLQEINMATLEVQYADAAIVEALNQKDLALANKNVKALSKAAANAARRLKQLDRIKEDATAIYQAERLIEYYQKASKELYPKMLSAFDKKGNVINNKVDLYNKTIATLNRNIQTITQKYMEAKHNLQQRHIPKPKAKVIRS